MPYMLEGRSVPLDAPFTATNTEGELIQFPANWIRLSSEEEKAAIGLTWEADPPAPPDQRFYWDHDLPKDHGQLVEQWVAQTRTTAGTLLAPSDWMVIREADNGVAVPAEWRTWREAIRTAAGDKVSAITATVDTEALAAYVTGAEYSSWPADPNAPTPTPAEAPAE